MNLNKALIIGNITRDPEIKALPTGMKVASFGIATNRTYKVNDVKKEDVEYHNIVAFGKTAETISTYCKKGDNLFIEGRIQTRSWDAQDGTKKYRTEIIVDNFQFGKKQQEKNTNEEEKQQRTSPSEDYPDGISVDEIPF